MVVSFFAVVSFVVAVVWLTGIVYHRFSREPARISGNSFSRFPTSNFRSRFLLHATLSDSKDTR